MMPVRRCQTATKFRKTMDGMYEPTFPSDPSGLDMTLFQVPPSQLRAPDVTVDDFYQAISRIRPSVCAADLDRQIEFTSTFGQDG